MICVSQERLRMDGTRLLPPLLEQRVPQNARLLHNDRRHVDFFFRWPSSAVQRRGIGRQVKSRPSSFQTNFWAPATGRGFDDCLLLDTSLFSRPGDRQQRSIFHVYR